MKTTTFLGMACMLFSTLTQAEEALTFTQVIYQEVAPGEKAYSYRLLVNENFLRFDGGSDDDGYILYDRQDRKVISINHEDGSRFIIQPEAKEFSTSRNIDVNTLSSNLKKAPKIQNIKAASHDIVANEMLCRQVLSFKGLLPDVTKAWAEYETLMQTQNQQTLGRTPQDMQTDCFLTNNITHATLFLDFGLPFSVRSTDGSFRVLQSYSQVEKPMSILNLRTDYREFRL